MSIGTVIADADTFESIEAKYHILWDIGHSVLPVENKSV